MTAGRAGTAACGGCGLSRARGHLERAVAYLEETRLAWGCWADEIRQLAEQTTGRPISMITGAHGDPGYGQALDIGGAVGEAVRVAGDGAAGCCRRRRGLPVCGGSRRE